MEFFFVVILNIYMRKGTRDTKLFSLLFSRFTHNEVVRKSIVRRGYCVKIFLKMSLKFSEE